ncbi:MAG: hypothetical protein J6T10_28990 [Methanobrevibacter sp.]|nr:hypothetical protein [Methanobrevibacter sp.]
MVEYFKLLESFVRGSGIKYKSIKDLTIDLAKSGGYYRDTYEFKCGTNRERTLYRNSFDSTLTALWILFYKNLFITKLNRYQDLRDYHVFIINKTFFITMGCINLDKLEHDDVINKYVNMALNSRIKEVMGKLKNPNRKCTAVCNKEVFNNTMLPLELVDPFLEDSSKSLNKLDIEIAIRNELGDNKIGNMLLDYMLSSNRQVRLNSIDTVLGLDRSDCTEKNREDIAESFNTIKRIFLQNSDFRVRKRFRKIKPESIKFSFEK